MFNFIKISSCAAILDFDHRSNHVILYDGIHDKSSNYVVRDMFALVHEIVTDKIIL